MAYETVGNLRRKLGLTASADELNKMDGVTSTAAELNLLDGSSTANSVASVAAILDSNKRLRTAAATVGTAGTNVTAVEYGDGVNHTTVLTLTSVAITIGDNASLGMGALIYTLPAGAQEVVSSYLSVGLTLAGTPTTDTPEIGLGTTVASGVVSVLGGTAAFENISEGAAMADIAGTAKVQYDEPNAASPAPLYIATSGGLNHTIYLNFADGWANVDAVAATATGTVVLNWRTLA